MGKKHYKAPPGGDARGALERGKRLFDSGRFREAIRELSLAVNSAEAQKLRGIALCQLGEFAQGRAALEEARRLEPEDSSVVMNFGVACQMAGDREAALSAFREAVRLNPENPNAQNVLGWVLLQMEHVEEALWAFDAALEAQPRLAEAHFNRGNALRIRGDDEEAVRSFRRAVGLQPKYFDAFNNLGAALLDLGRADEAIPILRQAIGLNDQAAQSIHNLAIAYFQLGNLAEARSILLKLNPKSADIQSWLLLGRIMREQGDADAALAMLDQTQSDDPRMAALGAAILADHARVDEALARLERGPVTAGTALSRGLLLPVIPRDEAEILAARSRLLETTNVEGEIRDPLNEVALTSFFLAYHPEPERPLQQAVCSSLVRLCPGLGWQSPHLEELRPPTGKIRLGVVSGLMHAHTIGRLFSRVIAELSGDEFEVTLFNAGNAKDDVTKMLAESATAVTLPISIESAQKRIAEARMDILFYPEVGMSPMTWYLALARLAPRQCVTWGHPMTTGSAAMDAFLSHEDLESNGAEGRYSERLVRLPHLPILYTRPEVALVPEGRFGLPEGKRLYICPQTLFKFHPRFDSVLRGILDGDPNGLLVLLKPRFSEWSQRLLARWSQTLPGLVDRIVFLPPLSRPNFVALLGMADAILDPTVFGGGNTSLEAFAVGAPVVTRPGEFLRERITLALYRKMGWTELVTSNDAEYIETVLRLGRDPEFRQYAHKSICSRSEVLFEDHRSVDALAGFFRDWAADGV